MKGGRVWILVADSRGDPDRQTSRAIDIGVPAEARVARAPYGPAPWHIG